MMDVSIICTAASWASASAFMILAQTPARPQPEDAIEDSTNIHPRYATRLVRQHGPNGSPFLIGEFVAHDFEPLGFGALNHGLTVRLNTAGAMAFCSLSVGKRAPYARFEFYRS